MPPAVYTRDSPEYKCKLLSYILAVKDEFRDREPDYVNFFNWAGRTFEYGGVAPFSRPAELATFLDHEVEIWSEEVDSNKKRRSGHEEGSEYDKLMRTFSKALDAITLDHWHWVVTQSGPNYKKYSEVPEEYRASVKRLVNSTGKRLVKPGDARLAASHAARMLQSSRTERFDFEYDVVKLERVVNSAMTRAREVGKPDLADSVHLLYMDALENMDLRVLLEKTLTQKCTEAETKEFQEYVRKTKKRLRSERAAQARAGQASKDSGPPSARSQRTKIHKDLETKSQPTPKSAPASSTLRSDRAARSKTDPKTTSQTPTPKVPVAKKEEPTDEKKTVGFSSTTGVFCGAPNRSGNHHPTEDSGYGSEQTGEKADSSTKGTTPSENGSSKQRAESVTSSQEAEQDDLEEARRASKRRRRAGSDDSGSYHPAMDNKRRSSKPAAKKSKTDTHSPASRDSSPLSEPPDEMDIEQAKEAYVDEMVRRKSAEAARQAIEDKYGPVSPSLIGDTRSEPAESWASMPSPTMEPARLAAPAQPAASSDADQATAGAQNSQDESRKDAPPNIPGPPPEGFTPDEGANAYKLITATVSEAIIPYFKHMETKLSKMEEQQKSIAKKASEQTLPSSKELLDAAKALQSGEIQGNNSETTQLISRLLKNAAEASIHAAEAARKAGEVARDVSEVLMQISSKESSTATASKSSQRGKRKG